MTTEATQLVMERADLEAAFQKTTSDLEALIEKANGEAAEAKTVSSETKAAIEAIAQASQDIGDRLAALEQRDHPETHSLATKSVGEMFTENDDFAKLQSKQVNKLRMEFKTAIVNATGQNQPLVPDDRVSFVQTTPNRRLTLRDLFPGGRTTSNLIQFPRENAFTNNANVQGAGASPYVPENVTKPESGITFTLKNEPVVTIAHWIPASRQVLDDAPALQAFINGRLMYGLKLKEELQFLKGTGADGEISGLNTDATAYVPTSPQLTNEIDIVRHAIKQAHVAEYSPDFIVLNPSDWYDIESRKVGASDDRYVVGDPANGLLAPRLWGLNVVATNSQTAGTFTLGDSRAAMIFDRQDAAVEAYFEDSTNVQKNMVTILAEERLAFAIWRTEAFITGSL